MQPIKKGQTPIQLKYTNNFFLKIYEINIISLYHHKIKITNYDKSRNIKQRINYFYKEKNHKIN